MNDPPEPRSAADHFEGALEASCDTLIALQLIRALVAGAGGVEGEIARRVTVEGEIARAIGSLRLAIAELRLARREEQSALTVGFVLDRRHGPSSGVGEEPAGPRGRSAHPSPRRTA